MPSEFKEQLSFSNIIFCVAWFLWSIAIVSASILLVRPYLMPAEGIQGFDGILMLTVFLVLFALMEGGATVIVRRFALIRPYQNGIYTPQKGPFRFISVGLFNWFCSECIMIYGLVVYYMSGLIWPIFMFGILGLILFLYHRPSLKSFMPNRRRG